MDIQALVALALQHKWIAVSAVLIGTLVRLLKEDGPIPINVPPNWRPALALALGLASAALAKVSNGTPWRQALMDGAVAAALAIVGHDVLIEGLRGGKELPLGKAPALKPAPPAEPAKSTPPPAAK